MGDLWCFIVTVVVVVVVIVLAVVVVVVVVIVFVGDIVDMGTSAYLLHSSGTLRDAALGWGEDRCISMGTFTFGSCCFITLPQRCSIGLKCGQIHKHL